MMGVTRIYTNTLSTEGRTQHSWSDAERGDIWAGSKLQSYREEFIFIDSTVNTREWLYLVRMAQCIFGRL